MSFFHPNMPPNGLQAMQAWTNSHGTSSHPTTQRQTSSRSWVPFQPTSHTPSVSDPPVDPPVYWPPGSPQRTGPSTDPIPQAAPSIRCVTVPHLPGLSRGSQASGGGRPRCHGEGGCFFLWVTRCMGCGVRQNQNLKRAIRWHNCASLVIYMWNPICSGDLGGNGPSVMRRSAAISMSGRPVGPKTSGVWLAWQITELFFARSNHFPKHTLGIQVASQKAPGPSKPTPNTF